MTDVNHAEELRALRLRAEAAETSRDEWRAEHDRVQKQRNDARQKETDAQRKAHAATERANRNAGLLDEARAQASTLLDLLRKHARRIPCPACGGIGSRTCATCDNGEVEHFHPEVEAVLKEGRQR